MIAVTHQYSSTLYSYSSSSHPAHVGFKAVVCASKRAPLKKLQNVIGAPPQRVSTVEAVVCSLLAARGVLMHSTRCLLHSLPLNDEARSGRRDLNPQPQPWQGYALPLSYFRQGVTSSVKWRSTTEQFTYHLIRTTSVFPPDHTERRSSYEHE